MRRLRWGAVAVVCMCGAIWAQTSLNGIPNQNISLSGQAATTVSIGGGLLAAGSCTTPVTISMPGAILGKTVQMTPSDGTLQSAGTNAVASVTATGTISAEICAYVASITPPAKTYTVQVIQ